MIQLSFLLVLVSILILLEVILEVHLIQLFLHSLLCFNPYFTGSNSGRIPEAQYDVVSTVFQSLFYWK